MSLVTGTTLSTFDQLVAYFSDLDVLAALSCCSKYQKEIVASQSKVTLYPIKIPTDCIFSETTGTVECKSMIKRFCFEMTGNPFIAHSMSLVYLFNYEYSDYHYGGVSKNGNQFYVFHNKITCGHSGNKFDNFVIASTIGKKFYLINTNFDVTDPKDIKIIKSAVLCYNSETRVIGGFSQTSVVVPYKEYKLDPENQGEMYWAPVIDEEEEDDDTFTADSPIDDLAINSLNEYEFRYKVVNGNTHAQVFYKERGKIKIVSNVDLSYNPPPLTVDETATLPLDAKDIRFVAINEIRRCSKIY